MIGEHDRVGAIGKTGSGKSQLLAYLWAKSRRQRLLVDVADHYHLGPDALAEGAIEARNVSEIDWRVRTIRFVPNGSATQYNDLFAAIFDRGQIDVWLDEAYGPTTEHRSPPFLYRTATQGRKHGIRLEFATQRPAKVMPELIDQAEHVYIFTLTRRDDFARLADRTGMDAGELAAAVRGLDRIEVASASPSGYLYHRLGSDELVRMPPLPADRLELARRHIVIPS